MSDSSNRERAVELLQELGQKEYEARCFVALCRLPTATAKEIGEASDVPRTRVYDAIRVLEDQGLVEVQHTNPQQFRAVGIDEAVGTLRNEYELRTAELGEVLTDLSPVEGSQDGDETHEVWGLSGQAAITNRVTSLLSKAEEEVVIVVGTDGVAYEPLVEALEDCTDDCTVLVGVATEELKDELAAKLPEAEVYVSEFGWLQESDGTPATLGRIALVDDAAMALSAVDTRQADDGPGERAVFARGHENGLVLLLRRLLTPG